MNPKNTQKIKQIEKILGAKVDGVWDDKDQGALDKITTQPQPKNVAQPAAEPGLTPQVGPPAGAMPATYT